MALCAVTQYLKIGLGYQRQLGMIPLFDVGNDANVPTWWSSLALLFCASLMVAIGAEHRRRGDAYIFWWVLAGVFGFISIDEVAMIHERVGNELSLRGRRALGAGQEYGGATWIYAYIVPGILLALAAIPFFLRLPTRTKGLFVLAAVTLVGGGVGVEFLAHAIRDPDRLWIYQLVTMLEEFLEMLGVVIFASALIDYIRLAFGGLSLRIEIGGRSESAPARTVDRVASRAPVEQVS